MQLNTALFFNFNMVNSSSSVPVIPIRCLSTATSHTHRSTAVLSTVLLWLITTHRHWMTATHPKLPTLLFSQHWREWLIQHWYSRNCLLRSRCSTHRCTLIHRSFLSAGFIGSAIGSVQGSVRYGVGTSHTCTSHTAASQSRVGTPSTAVWIIVTGVSRVSAVVGAIQGRGSGPYAASACSATQTRVTHTTTTAAAAAASANRVAVSSTWRER